MLFLTARGVEWPVLIFKVAPRFNAIPNHTIYPLRGLRHLITALGTNPLVPESNLEDHPYQLSLVDLRCWVKNTFPADLLDLFRQQPKTVKLVHYTASNFLFFSPSSPPSCATEHAAIKSSTAIPGSDGPP